ncbi:MAG: nitrophenyl compound nitroreductase subunit ArsF family protein [Bacteroidota bacterium]|nr:nitrophenyl compound nitroreductase subunit ArsF family protein [Bacteroidota bacterium]
MAHLRILRSLLLFIPALLFVSPGEGTCTQFCHADPPKTKIIVHYFHGTVRCKTCLTIEAYTKEAVELFFSREISNKSLVFLPENIDEEKNAHYIDEFQLISSSVVLEAVRDGKRMKWKLLPKVWELVHEKNKFFDYIANETREFMRGLP